MLTNEEKRVIVYTDASQPTVSSEVTPETPLEDLSLNWRERDLPEKERTKHVHRLHPYLGKFIPQLVEVFLRKYFLPGQTMLDPFCGSGTALVQANEQGINSTGCDVSAFNALLCRAKTVHYDHAKLRREVLDILERTRIRTHTNVHQLLLWPDEQSFRPISETDDRYLNTWFAPQALNELLTYRALIETGGYEYQDLLKVILSRSARSARLTTHFDLDFPKRPQTEPYWCYKHSRECYPTTEAFKFIERYSLDTLRRVQEFAARRTNAWVTIYHADSREVIFPPIDGIITSPPYVGLIDYHEQHAYAYHLLGLDDKREKEIGPAVNGSSQKAQRQYQQDIATVFNRVMERMAGGGRLVVVANDRAHLYPEIANLIGVETEGIVQRHVNRRTGRRSSEFYESIFIWRKR
ncbi:MAG: class I SAM-dependent methyltransferase [Anaerolineae bacterium]|nr:class I SAM-dependent methyltransferase [Anaerolineae bacterium]